MCTSLVLSLIWTELEQKRRYVGGLGLEVGNNLGSVKSGGQRGMYLLVQAWRVELDLTG